MRLSRGGTHGSGGTGSAARALEWDEFDPRSHGAAWRRCALAVAAVLVFGAIGVVISPAKPAGRHRVPVRPGLRLGRELDGQRLRSHLGRSGHLAQRRHLPALHRRQRLRRQRELLRRRRPQRRGQRVLPERRLDGVFASGLANPLSLVFDNQGNLYVGQQGTPYIAEFNSSGQNVANFGPVTTQETGDDWIDLRATSAPSITRPRATRSSATTSAPTPRRPTSTSSP